MNRFDVYLNPTTFPILLVLAGVLFFGCGQVEEADTYFPMPDRELELIRSEAQTFMADTVLTGLNRPWSMEFLPDEEKTVLISERAGNILVVRNGQLQESPLEGNIPAGLRDVERHPDYEENGWIYLSYFVDPDGDDGGYTRLMRGRLDGNALVDEETIYSAGPFRKYGAWTGSRITFDDEGYLYFAVGISGERMNAQDKTNQAGKTMRLHEDGSIPSDNPFVNTSDAHPEIFTYGHREHQGLIRHPLTGEIWSNEHGEKGGDELNILRPGLNYGWPLATYSTEYDGTPIAGDSTWNSMEPPIHHWTPAIAPSGMAVVTGDTYPGWIGNVFTGSLIQRMLNRTDMDNGNVVGDEMLLQHIGRVRSIRQAPDGYLYFITEDTGLMVRLLPGPLD